jgi:hypothetical protein
MAEAGMSEMGRYAHPTLPRVAGEDSLLALPQCGGGPGWRCIRSDPA